MITTTYKCDRCGVEQPTHEQMWEIIFHFRPFDKRPYQAMQYMPATALWCRNCCELYPQMLKKKEETPTPAPPPTLEDLLREVIREEVDNGRS